MYYAVIMSRNALSDFITLPLPFRLHDNERKVSYELTKSFSMLSVYDQYCVNASFYLHY